MSFEEIKTRTQEDPNDTLKTGIVAPIPTVSALAEKGVLPAKMEKSKIAGSCGD